MSSFRNVGLYRLHHLIQAHFIQEYWRLEGSKIEVVKEEGN